MTTRRDPPGGRTLSSAEYADTAKMTVESCVAFCAAKNYAYAGVEYGQECCASLPSVVSVYRFADRIIRVCAFGLVRLLSVRVCIWVWIVHLGMDTDTDMDMGILWTGDTARGGDTNRLRRHHWQRRRQNRRHGLQHALHGRRDRALRRRLYVLPLPSPLLRPPAPCLTRRVCASCVRACVRVDRPAERVLERRDAPRGAEQPRQGRRLDRPGVLHVSPPSSSPPLPSPSPPYPPHPIAPDHTTRDVANAPSPSPGTPSPRARSPSAPPPPAG